MFNLNLHRFLQVYHDMGADDEPDVDCNYTPYRIFVLFSRLLPFIYNLLKDRHDKIDVYPHSIFNKEKNRMDAYLMIAKIDTKNREKEDQLLELSNEEKQAIQKKIDEIQSKYINYALIDSHELYNLTDKRYSFPYFNSILEYSLNESSYNPFIKHEGIYLTFNPYADF